MSRVERKERARLKNVKFTGRGGNDRVSEASPLYHCIMFFCFVFPFFFKSLDSKGFHGDFTPVMNRRL